MPIVECYKLGEVKLEPSLANIRLFSKTKEKPPKNKEVEGKYSIEVREKKKTR